MVANRAVAGLAPIYFVVIVGIWSVHPTLSLDALDRIYEQAVYLSGSDLFLVKPLTTFVTENKTPTIFMASQRLKDTICADTLFLARPHGDSRAGYLSQSR